MKTFIKLLFLMSMWMCLSVVYAQPTVGVVFDGPSVFTGDEAKMQQLDEKLAELLPPDK